MFALYEARRGGDLLAFTEKKESSNSVHKESHKDFIVKGQGGWKSSPPPHSSGSQGAFLLRAALAPGRFPLFLEDQVMMMKSPVKAKLSPLGATFLSHLLAW